MYDLLTARPHEPPDARFTPEEFALYRDGYGQALMKALEVIDHANRRFRLRVRTHRLERQRRAKENGQ